MLPQGRQTWGRSLSEECSQGCPAGLCDAGGLPREALVTCNAVRKERMSETREFYRKLDTELQMSGELPPREFEGALRAWSRSGKNLATEMNKLLQG
mmetsp:Transcript_25634/g.74171  ORF Transcript_25634/g.74171 Transcript_25634/m.74171 type:complete len:97 (+) Transcript_25634:942-1232(+)